MHLDEQQVAANWQALINIIDTEFDGERKVKLTELYTFFQDRMMVMPASSFEHYHNCFAGGYVDHILRVVNIASANYEMWKTMGSECTGYSKEELIFAALNHDLGKVGTREFEMYRPNPSEWHRKNQGKIYEINPDIPFMSVPDRSLLLLQEFGITYTQNEMMGIKLHDGLYDESNKPYFIAFRPESRMRVNLPIVLHHADHMASQIEYEQWKGSSSTSIAESKKVARKAYNSKTISGANDSAKDLFKDLFGDKK
tara:strand:- start:1873 stop:2637 length:765 start_codon:yes stop_codon:yes gene_type:complete